MDRRTFLGATISAPLLLSASQDIGQQKPTATFEGDYFDLTIKKTLVQIGNQYKVAITINDMLPGPTLKWKKGDTVTIKVTNMLDEPTSLHWHGIILPYTMDGVPGVSFPGIMPGESFTYRFQIKQSGTYWYHSHSGFQEQEGVHGSIVIEDGIASDRDYVVALHDKSMESADTIYRKLKLQSDYYNYRKRTIFDFLHEVEAYGFIEAFKKRAMWNRMRMNDRDLSDVTGATYTYMMNEHSAKDPAFFAFRPGERVRLRFINQSAMSYFDVRIPGLKMRVVAADGIEVEPVEVDDLRIAVAESYDVIVEPKEEAYVIYAESIDRNGFVYGYLATSTAKKAPLPEHYPFESLKMVDMGMMMGKMEHRMQKNPWPITPLPKRKGVAWTMDAMMPMVRLDDPGVGLRGVAKRRKVLTYADLVSKEVDDRTPDREIVLHLTGNMERYIWAINGIPYYESKPLEFRYGERLRITFINDTMMNHPMHLHGMWSDVENGGKILRKHTVNVQPGSKVHMRVNVDATGRWVFHCHLLYHMGGMFREVKVLS